MLFNSLMKILEIGTIPSTWTCYYYKPQNGFVENDLFPSREKVETWGKKLQFPEDVNRTLLAYHAEISNNDAFKRLWCLYYTMLFTHYDTENVYAEHYQKWPLPEQMDEGSSVVFRAVVLMAHYDRMHHQLEQRGLTQAESYTIINFNFSIQETYQSTGTYGLTEEKMWWIWSFMLGRLFRVGLLEFEITRFNYHYTVFKNSRGEHKALCSKKNLHFDEKGFRSERGFYNPAFMEDGENVTGYGFHESGLYNPEKVVLNITEWKKAVTTGDYVLNIHIPGDDKLTPEAVKETIDQARAFFTAHFPELPIKALVCYTWLLDTSLQEYLPGTSNIISFQNLFTIIMNTVDSDCLFSYIFNCLPCPLDRLVPQNDFQANILSLFKQGGAIRDGIGYILL